MPMKPDMSTELRHLVREVLRDMMASGPPVTGCANEPVRIENDQDLAAFVARVIEPATLDKIRSGKLRFTLNGPGAHAAATPGSALTGVITEQKLDGLATAGTLVLGPGAVLTPLARDKARRLGLKIERRR